MRIKYCDICGDYMEPTEPSGSGYKNIHYTVEINSNAYSSSRGYMDICFKCIGKVKELFKK